MKKTKKLSKMNKGELAVKIIALALSIMMIATTFISLIFYLLNK